MKNKKYQEAKLKSISVRANYFALLVSVASIVGAVMFLLLIQYHARQDAYHQVEARARVLGYVFGEQVQFYRRIFQRLAERQEVNDLLFLENEATASEWAQRQNRLLPDSVGMALVTDQGKLLGNPGEQYIGKICLEDLRTRIRGKKLLEPPVHRSIPRYAHFDLITDIRGPDGKLNGMLFASISIEAIQSALDKIVQKGESIELLDTKKNVFVSAGTRTGKENFVTLSQAVPNTDWTMKLAFDVPSPPPFYYWSSAGIILAAILFSGSVLYLMRFSLRGLVGEMNSIRSGLERIVTGTFDGSLPSPRFRETADAMPAIESISKMIYDRNQLLKQISETDELTELFNRRRMLYELKRVIAQASRGVKATVVSLDLDHFKPINDHYGHAVGDTVLQAFATALMASRRGSDIVGRMGGDEFVAILIEPTESADAWYQRLSQNFAKQLKEIESADKVSGCTISAGAISVLPDDSNPEMVLKKVDTALYRAKGEGRARLVSL
ncbi:MAG: sensor domain-containing diguanylate cyclase [Acidiferrobacterales bacterium]|nr:sensor domain-containing diguanylate cyclase [Acidiferrobacterales bacterium]